jgi:hypothetical protein
VLHHRRSAAKFIGGDLAAAVVLDLGSAVAVDVLRRRALAQSGALVGV